MTLWHLKLSHNTPCDFLNIVQKAGYDMYARIYRPMTEMDAGTEILMQLSEQFFEFYSVFKKLADIFENIFLFHKTA